MRSSISAAWVVAAETRRTNRDWDGEPDLVGTPDTIVERLAPYLGIGFHSMFFDFPPPYDRETLERLATEVRPQLERQLEALPTS